MEEIEVRVKASVEATVEQRFDIARGHLQRLVDELPKLEAIRSKAFEYVWGSKSPIEKPPRPIGNVVRETVRASDLRITFSRDKYTCRYAHCRRRTIFIPVLRELSRLFPDLLPYNKNWRPLDKHLLYWMCGTSLEHRVSFPFGGTSIAENLITSCYHCNDLKNYLPIEVLGWTLTEPANDDWDGLSRFLPALKTIQPTKNP